MRQVQTKLHMSQGKLSDGRMHQQWSLIKPPPVNKNFYLGPHVNLSVTGNNNNTNIGNTNSNSNNVGSSGGTNRIGPRSQKRVSDNTMSHGAHYCKLPKISKGSTKDPIYVDDDDDNSVQPKHETTDIVKQRYSYTEEDAKFIVQLYDEYEAANPLMSMHQILNKIRDINPNYANLDYRSIARWKQKHTDDPTQAVVRKRGPYVDEKFLQFVLSKLRFKAIYKSQRNGTQKSSDIHKLVNACYSYGLVREIAKSCQKIYLGKDDLKDKDIASVTDLAFSNCWINDFMIRFSLHKRKITSTFDIKKIPSDDEIREQMAKIASVIESGYNLNCVFSADETAINWDKALRWQYVKEGEKPESAGDSKLRFTAMIHAAANGVTGPPCKFLTFIYIHSTFN